MSLEQFIAVATFVMLAGQLFSTVISYKIRLDIADDISAIRERTARCETALGLRDPGEGYSRGGRRTTGE